MILPDSSWAVWAGILSNATEIHVDIPLIHPIVNNNNNNNDNHNNNPSYIYHNERDGLYFGTHVGRGRFQFNITGVNPIA